MYLNDIYSAFDCILICRFVHFISIKHLQFIFFYIVLRGNGYYTNTAMNYLFHLFLSYIQISFDHSTLSLVPLSTRDPLDTAHIFFEEGAQVTLSIPLLKYQ